MQTKRDQLIAHNIKKCHIILFCKQVKGNDSQWLETTLKYLVRYPFGEIVCDARSLHACMTYNVHVHATVDFRDLTFPCDIQW